MNSTDFHASEISPLVIDAEEQSGCEDDKEQRNSATVWQTVLNISKTCMGTGTLALPYAARQAGLLLNSMGLLVVAAWTAYNVQRLCLCLELLPHHSKKRTAHEGASMLGKVAFYSLGPVGLHLLDLTFAFLLIGVIVAYLDAALSFLSDSMTSGSVSLDAAGVAVVIALLSSVPDMGYLAKASAAGLLVLFGTFVVIAFYGGSSGASLSLWPENGIRGVSHWFGCVVFGFGTVPLTYNLRESMAEPQYMVVSAIIGIGGTAVAYIILSSGILLLYPEVEGDILQELPTSSFLPALARLAMVVVVLMTAPLLVVPCGELIEGKAFAGETVTAFARTLIRMALCVLCAGIALFMPGFVYVLSFVGCCWCLLSFVFPPLFHLSLVLKKQEAAEARQHDPCFAKWTAALRIVWIDAFMIVCGILVTAVSIIYTFSSLLAKT